MLSKLFLSAFGLSAILDLKTQARQLQRRMLGLEITGFCCFFVVMIENSKLSNEEIRRYSRHLILPNVGLEGQQKLKTAKVLLIGAGGLGSPLGLYLAAAGVGTIGLVEFDLVEESNLQRQVIHGTENLGQKKALSAKNRMQSINPNIKVNIYDERLTSSNALEIIRNYDLVIDGTDNFPTRYLTNDACVLLGKPNVYGSIFRFEGQASVFDASQGPCYRCLFPEPPAPESVPSCAEGGVLGILPGTIGTIQATEAIKLILGIGQPLVGRLLLYNALSMSFQELGFAKNPNCPVCGENPTITALVDYEEFCGAKATSAASTTQSISPKELKKRLAAGEKIPIIDVRNPNEWEIVNLEHWGAKLVPLSTIDKNMDFPEGAVFHCKSGLRSAKAIKRLQGQQPKPYYNLEGGILAWIKTIETDLPTY